jgi:hypothetical protein
MASGRDTGLGVCLVLPPRGCRNGSACFVGSIFFCVLFRPGACADSHDPGHLLNRRNLTRNEDPDRSFTASSRSFRRAQWGAPPGVLFSIALPGSTAQELLPAK